MAIIAEEKKEIASESGHWYALDGTPKYTIVGKNGKERNTTLRDARVLGLVPSVTTILQVAAKPGLDLWKQKQVMMAALTLPRLAGETDEAYIDRVVVDAGEVSRKARDKGTAIHGAIECHFKKEYHPGEWDQHVDAVIKACRAEGIDLYGGEAERAFASPLGYGGKVDWHSKTQNIVLDFKTTEALKDTTKPYDEHGMQLAAYRMGLNMPTARRVNVFVDYAAQVRVCILPDEEAAKHEQMFLALLNFWQISKSYNPARVAA